MDKTYGLIIAKKHSGRLKNKNWLDFGEKYQGGAKPMFQWNLEKCLRVFDKVYVSSDYDYILDVALKCGATPIKRPLELCRDGVPNIPVYRHAYEEMGKPNILVSVQANSPTIKQHLIQQAKDLMERYSFSELMTCHPNFKIYGSIWAMTGWKLEKYEECCGDFYSPKPEVLLIDPSVDIHTEEDLLKAKKVKHI